MAMLKKKIIRRTIFCLAVLACLPAPLFAQVAQGIEKPVALYTFTEGEGATVKDHSGNGLHLAIKKAEWVSDDGSGMRFEKDHALLATEVNKVVDFGNSNFSVFARVRVKEFRKFASLATTFGASEGLYTGWRFCVMKDGRLLFGWANAKGKYDHVLSKNTLVAGQWHWVGLVKEGRRIIFYLDGNRVGSGRMKSPVIADRRHILTVGFEANNAGQFTGMMRHLRVYDRALGQELVHQITGVKPLPQPKSAKKSNQLRVNFKAYPKPGVILVAADAQDFDALPEKVRLAITWGQKDSRTVTPLLLKADKKLDVSLDVADLPQGMVSVSAGLIGPDGKAFGNVISKKVQWPGRDPAYADFKILNNFAWEIVNAKGRDSTRGPFTFRLPIDRWLWIRAEGPGAVELVVDQATESNPVIKLEDGAKQVTAMRAAQPGKHILRVNGKLDSLIVRAVPIICLGHLHSVPKKMPVAPFTWEWMEKHVNPYGNVMTSFYRGPVPEQVGLWKQRGKQWISKSARIWYKKTNALPNDTIKRIVEFNAAAHGYANPLMDGILVDEFYKAVDLYDAHIKALEQMAKDKRFENKTFHAYYAGRPHESKAFLRFLEKVRELGGKLYVEAYCAGADTEAGAWTDIRCRIDDRYAAVQQQMPNLNPDTVWTFAVFSNPEPWASGYPHANFNTYLDMQFQKVATHPALFGLGGVSFWHPEYLNEPSWRLLGQMCRHYCIEGSRVRLQNDPYILNHIANPDFTNGLTGWTAQPAEDDSMRTNSRDGYGKLQGRYYRGNDTFLVMRRSAQRPNIVSQTIRNLQPGRMYSLRMYSARLDELDKEQSQKALHGIRIDIRNAELQSGPQMQHQFPLRCYRGKFRFTKKKPLWTNYYWRVFKATGATAELAISDWKSADDPGGPTGEQLMLNFIEIQPYF